MKTERPWTEVGHSVLKVDALGLACGPLADDAAFRERWHRIKQLAGLEATSPVHRSIALLTIRTLFIAALLPLYACSADDSDMQPEPAPVVSAPQAQAPQAETAPTTEAQAEDVVEAGEEVAAETGSQSEIVLAQAGTAAAAKSKFVAGQDYEVVKPAQPTSAGPGEVEVLEFFMYTCLHCFNFEPHMNN